MRLVILGLSITSSWGNGHATTYRALVRELDKRGHDVLFLERDVPWYADNRDLPEPPFGSTALYGGRDELVSAFAETIRRADAVILGSFVPDGDWLSVWLAEVVPGVYAFYDIDTPVTLRMLEAGTCDYLSQEAIGAFDLYLSFAGGSVLRTLEDTYGAKRAVPLYCSVDPDGYFPECGERRWDLGYLGTYSSDRQPGLERLLLEPAEALPAHRFVVAGPKFPPEVKWPPNVERIEHLPPPRHRGFYNSQRFTLNITRRDMIGAGHSPSVRLFEAAACGVPIISDYWQGLEDFFEPGEEILLAREASETVAYLSRYPARHCAAVAEKARRRVLAEHAAARRVVELERYLIGDS